MAFPRPDDLPSPGFRIPDPLAAAGDEDHGYFRLGGTVGREAANARPDVLRAQAALAEAGYFDTRATEGPTGWYGKPLELAIRRYQKDRGLTVDGYMAPDGETITALRNDAGPALAHRPVPDLKTVDEHHERRARGEPGLLVLPVDGSDRNWTKTTVTAADPLPGGQKDPGIRLAAMSRTSPLGQDDPLKAPMITGRGIAGAVAAETAPGILQRQPDSADAAAKNFGEFLAATRAALDEGVREAFGKIERHETENTRLTNRIIVQECLKVIEAKMKPRGYQFDMSPGQLRTGSRVMICRSGQ